MKKLLLAIVLFWASPLHAAYTFVVSTSNGSTGGNGVTAPGTGSINTSTVTFFTAFVSDYGAATACTLADSQSNSWTLRDTRTDGVNGRIRVFDVVSPMVSATHTFSCNGTGSYPSIAVLGWTGQATTPFDQVSGLANGSTVTSIQPGAITPASGELVLTAVQTFDNTGLGVSGGGTWTVRENVNHSGSNHFGVAVASSVTSSGSTNPTWAWTNSSAGASTDIISYQPSTGGGGGGGVWTPISHGAMGGDTNTATVTLNTTGGDFLAVATSMLATVTSCTPTDSKSNSWTGLTVQSYVTDLKVQIWYALASSGTVGSGHSFTCTTSGGAPSIAAMAWSGRAASPFDTQNGSTALATTIQPGPITVPTNNLVLTALSFKPGITASISSPFTIQDQTTGGGGNYFEIAFASMLQSSTGSVNPTWTVTGAADALAVAIADFTAASATGLKAGTLTLLGVGR